MRKQRKLRRRPDYFVELDDTEFISRFRLSKEAVLRLFNVVREKLEHRTDRNEAVPPMSQLLLTLRYFASGDFLISVGDFVGIDKGTASRIIKKSSETIACLAPAFLKFPEAPEEIARNQEIF